VEALSPEYIERKGKIETYHRFEIVIRDEFLRLYLDPHFDLV
jgi:hypothetical protein